MRNKVKKIRVGLSGLRVAELLEDLSVSMSEDGKAKVVYGDIQKLENVQQINQTKREQSADIDADDTTDKYKICTGYDCSVQRTMFTPPEQAMLLGEEIQEDGTVVSSRDDEPPEFAAGYYTRVRGGTILAMWILRVKFSHGDVTNESAGDGKINPQSDTLSFESLTRACDHAFRAYKEVDTIEEAEEFLSAETLKKIYPKKKKDTADAPSADEIV